MCGRADSGARIVPGVAPAGGDTLVPRRLDAGVTADSDVIAARVPGDGSGMVVVPVVVNRLVLGMTFDLLCNNKIYLISVSLFLAQHFNWLCYCNHTSLVGAAILFSLRLIQDMTEIRLRSNPQL